MGEHQGFVHEGLPGEDFVRGGRQGRRTVESHGFAVNALCVVSTCP
jgi:hypothetical protein